MMGTAGTVVMQTWRIQWLSIMTVMCTNVLHVNSCQKTGKVSCMRMVQLK